MKFDLVVIGGGISGLGLAWLAAKRRLSVCLIEKETLGSGASGNSLRIMHGGLRYLQGMDLKRSIESALDQTRLANTWPDHFEKLPCLMPLDETGLRSPWIVGAGLRVYKGLLRMKGLQAVARTLSVEKITHDLPELAQLFPYGALAWEDLLLLKPDAFIETLKLEAEGNGAHILTNLTVKSASLKAGVWNIEAEKGEIFEAKYVINTAGPGSAKVLINDVSGRPQPEWCIAYNIILNQPSPTKYALGLKSKRGRLYFLVPRGDSCALGTGYAEWKGGSIIPSQTEIGNFWNEFKQMLPECPLSSADIAHVESGLLPKSRGKAVMPDTRRQVFFDANYVELISTKYTTFLSQAEQVLSRISI